MKIAVVGGTGVVGKEILSTLAENGFQDCDVAVLGRRASLGKELSFGEKKILKVQSLEDYDFKGTDLAFFCVGSQISQEYAPKAVAAGAYVIDKSSHFRMQEDVPLIVPEVNGEDCQGRLLEGPCVIASPNCVAIPLSMALKPLEGIAPLKRVVLSTYQSVSGAGQAAMDELFQGTRNVYMNQDVDPEQFPKPIVFNVIPHIDTFNEDGSTGEEEKVVEETQKILEIELPLSATCVRVPTFIGHALSVNVEFDAPITPEAARACYSLKSGVMVVDRPEEEAYATPLEIAGEDVVVVSRIREDKSVPYGLNLWVVCDNLRKGAALNAVQIAQLLQKLDLI